MNRIRNCVLAGVVVSLLSAAAWAQSPADPKPLPSRYQVIPYSHNSAVMIDTQSGQSWKLERDAEKPGSFVWVPIRKLQTNMDLDDWQERMKKFKEQRRKRREAEFGAEPIVPLDAEQLGAEPPAPLELIAEPVLEVNGKPLEIVEELPKVDLSP